MGRIAKWLSCWRKRRIFGCEPAAEIAAVSGESDGRRLLERAELEPYLQRLLQRQFADAQDKLDAPHYWQHVGSLVLGAATRSAAIMAWRDDESVADYFVRVLPAMAALAEEYRSDDNDADGYGLGTVRELEVALQAIVRNYRVIGEPSVGD